MKKVLLIVIVAVVALAVLLICYQNSTGLLQGSVTIHNQGESVTLSEAEAKVVRSIFTLHFYRYGIGGCPYNDGVSITIGDREFLLATDGCESAKDSKNGNCMEINRVEWKLIQQIFAEHFGKTLID